MIVTTDRQTDRQTVVTPHDIYMHDIYIYGATGRELPSRTFTAVFESVTARAAARRIAAYAAAHATAAPFRRSTRTCSTLSIFIDRRANQERLREFLRPPPPTPTRSEQATLTRCTVRTLTQPVLWCVRLKRELAPAGGSLKEPPGGGWGESPRPGGKTGGALKAPPGLRPGRGRCGDRRERAHPPPSWPT